MSPRHPRTLAVLATAALAGSLTLSSCAAFSDDTTAVEDGGTAKVVASFYPLQYVAERVAGDRAVVTSLTAPGQEPHDLELSVADNALLSGADLVVLEGGLQAAVDAAVEQNATGELLDVTDVIELQPITGEHDHAEEEHDHDDLGDLDPHFWLDPTLLAEAGDAVGESMSEVDPEHAEEYAERAAALRRDLEQLDTDLESGLASCERETIVVSHDAFGYLDRYGLDVEAVAGLSPEAEPTPADLGRLQELIAEDGTTTVFSERLASPRLTRTLADDAGVATAVLDPVEGLTAETADEDYISLMRSNLEALRAANGCG